MATVGKLELSICKLRSFRFKKLDLFFTSVHHNDNIQSGNTIYVYTVY